MAYAEKKAEAEAEAKATEECTVVRTHIKAKAYWRPKPYPSMFYNSLCSKIQGLNLLEANLITCII